QGEIGCELGRGPGLPARLLEQGDDLDSLGLQLGALALLDPPQELDHLPEDGGHERGEGFRHDRGLRAWTAPAGPAPGTGQTMYRASWSWVGRVPQGGRRRGPGRP